MNTPALVTALADQLGFKLVTYLGNIKEARAVGQWAEGNCEPANPEDLERLLLAFQAANLIMSRGSAGVAQAWFQGLNPRLGRTISRAATARGQRQRRRAPDSLSSKTIRGFGLTYGHAQHLPWTVRSADVDPLWLTAMPGAAK